MKITIANLYKHYGSFQALNGLNLTIRRGMFGLLGPNGAGKTTLMKILATLEPISKGTVLITEQREAEAHQERAGLLKNQSQARRYTLGKDDQAIRSMLGYLPQEFGVYKKLTGFEYLDYVAMMKGITHSKQRKEEVHQVLEKVNLTEQAKKRVGTYSGGMKQRIGIAQALLGSPKIIIVDEPTAGLDPEERIRFRNLLSDLSTERIVILSTHIVADIESSCSQLALMRKGRVIFQGTQESLLNQVKDRIWTGIIEESQLHHLKQAVKFISARKIAGAQEVRVMSDSEPFPGAERARPGLEDAYIAVMGADEANHTEMQRTPESAHWRARA